MSRKMGDLSLEERQKILIDLMTLKSAQVQEIHNVNSVTIQHIKWHHHPQGGAVKRGQYHLDLLEGYEDPVLTEARKLKAKDMTSAEIAEEMDVDVSLINKIWLKI